MIENWEIYAVVGFLVMPLAIGWILGCLIPIWWVILLFFSPEKADKFVEHLKKYDSKLEFNSGNYHKSGSRIENYIGED
jgi:hypothetical protein